MRITIEIDEVLLAKAEQLSGISDKNLLIDKALRLFIIIESQKKLMTFRGKIALDDEAFK